MAIAMIRDRGRGPEIEGTRITVDDLLPHLLDPDATEASICARYDLTPEQVAAARAYALNEPDVVLGDHLRNQDRKAPENPPEVIETARKAHAALLEFKEWLARREATEGPAGNGQSASRGLPTFKEWLAERRSRPGGGA